jgi:hypothetical protein
MISLKIDCYFSYQLEANSRHLTLAELVAAACFFVTEFFTLYAYADRVSTAGCF